MSKTRIALLAVVVVFVGLQFVPVSRTNPPVESDVVAPPEVKSILRRACYDCHSNETVWGWHTHIAPVSFLVAHDVSEGHEHLNFSRWGLMDPKHEAILPQKIQEEVNEGGMPPMIYTAVHPAARLTDAERASIVAWAQSLEGAGKSASTKHE